MFRPLIATLLVLSLIELLATLFVPWFLAAGLFLFIVEAVVVGYCIAQLIIAKGRALGQQEVPLWNGLVRVVSWNPTEGVIFLKNKQLHFVDDDVNDGGGIAAIYPLLGEELVLRVPLEIQTLVFSDKDVLTKEYMPLEIQGTMYWKVRDLSRFYLLVSREVHYASDTGAHEVVASPSRPKFEVAEHWLRSMAEEKTRAVVSRVSTGLLIAEQLAADIPSGLFGAERLLGVGGEAVGGYRAATDGLAKAIKDEFDLTVKAYGLEIHNVALQEVRLPPEIHAAAVQACQSAYLPLRAQAEAAALKSKLQAEVEILGQDAVGIREIAANSPALAFQDFLSSMFLDLNRKRVAKSSN